MPDPSTRHEAAVTSAVREARNHDTFTNRLRIADGGSTGGSPIFFLGGCERRGPAAPFLCKALYRPRVGATAAVG